MKTQKIQETLLSIKTEFMTHHLQFIKSIINIIRTAKELNSFMQFTIIQLIPIHYNIKNYLQVHKFHSNKQPTTTAAAK
jgi:hypothetical protein